MSAARAVSAIARVTWAWALVGSLLALAALPSALQAQSCSTPTFTSTLSGGALYVVFANSDTAKLRPISQHSRLDVALMAAATVGSSDPTGYGRVVPPRGEYLVRACVPSGGRDTVRLPGRVDTVFVPTPPPTPPADTTPPVVTPPPPPAPPPPPVDTTPVPPIVLPADTLSPTGYAPRLLWTAARQATWSRMARERHPLFVMMEGNAKLTGTSGQRYGENGVYGAWVYQATGDTAIGRAAVRFALKAAKDTLRNANQVRDQFLSDVLRFSFLRPLLTSVERDSLVAALDQSAKYIMAIGTRQYDGDIRTSDGDATIGYYAGLLALDLETENLPNRPRWTDSTTKQNKVPAGGLTVTGDNRSTLRNAIDWYAKHNAGGVWDESTEYNFASTAYLALMYEAARTRLGVDTFPLVKAWLQDAVQAEAFVLSPDLKYGVQWGDNQDVNSLILYRRHNWLALLGGVTGHPLPMTLFRALHAIHGYQSTNLMSRAFWLIDPYQGDVAIPTGGFIAPGRGHLYVRDGDAQVLLAASNRSREDHDHRWIHDIQVYTGGERAVARPINYGAPSSDHLGPNGVTYGGFGTMYNGGMTRADTGAGWWSITGATGGSLYDSGYYNPPPAYLKLGQRTSLYTTAGTSKVLVTRDTFDMVDPRSLAKFDRYHRNDTAFVSQADGKFWSIWHPRGGQPVVDTTCGCQASWTTAKGQTITLYWWSTAPVQTALYDEKVLWPGTRPSTAEKHWQLRLHTPGVLTQVVVIGAAIPTFDGTTVTVGGKRITITTASVAVR